ncbi:MAG: hypothetical protein IPM57_08220 [Oligoflexia bacterium]|nr:hypothetical protein [Oligoflexia bacterium]
MNKFYGGIFLALLLSLAGAGCAKKKNEINNVATEAHLLKSDLTGKTYSAVKTIVSADENLDATGVIPGFHADMGYVEFVVTEKELQARRVGEPNRTPETATVVAAFPITKHFDIIKETNDFGETTNKIVEDEKKPWNQRAYMRVDFGENKVKSTKLENIFSSEIEEQGSQVVTPLLQEGNLLSFDVDATITQKDYLDDGGGHLYELISGGLRAKIKNTFMQVKPSDYKAYEMGNKEFARFGYFRTYENFINPDKGVTVSGRKLYANRFNVCEANEKTANLSCSTNKIVYVLNKGFPEEFRQAARDVVKAWNKSFQKALEREDDIVILDESVQPEIGDTRYNMIAGIDEKVPTGLLGVSQTANNPSTGETLSARSSVYLGTVRVIGGTAAEQFDMIINGAVDEIKSSKIEKEIKTNTGPKLLTEKMKLNNKFLNSKVLNQKPNFAAPKAATIAKIKSVVSEPVGNATSRKKSALDKLLGFFDISDLTWSQAKNTKYDELKNTLQIATSSKLEKQKELALIEKGIHGAEFVEPAVELYILKFIAENQGKPINELREKIKQEVRYLVFYTTLIHEMGHNFGLRHNFASSGDRKNYTEKYFELEKKKQQLNPEDPQYVMLELEQESYDFSSVMDYTGSFHESHGGTGHYDDAAIRYAYNTSINKDGDPITGVVRGYKFCTDHEVQEDMMCQRWDKGTNVTQSTVKHIQDYNRNYYFRNFRRDRANFGNPMSYFGRILWRTMFPVRQVSDELIYQLITSPTVSAGANQCDSKFLRESIDSGEIGNLCDNSVLQKYAQSGVEIRDWSQLVYLLLKEDLSGFRKDPMSYKANGFADLIFANYHASNFFASVIGTPEPGLYYPMGNEMTGYELEALPAIEGNDDEKLMAFLASKGVTGDQAQALLPKIRGNIVDLKPGPVAKYLLSRVTQDGSFRQVDIMSHLYDKLAALIIMGARGIPVQKYWDLSMNTNMFFSPPTKNLSSALVNALINETNMIASANVKTRGGNVINATMPAALNLNTKYYALITALTDFVSDQSTEFADKMRICSDTEKGCQDALGLGLASFRGASGQDSYRAVQVPTGDSIAYALVKKAEDFSKMRDEAILDVKNKDKHLANLKEIVKQASQDQKALMNILEEKAKDLAKKLEPIYGASKQSLWSVIMASAEKIEEANVSEVANLKETLKGTLDQVSEVVKQSLNEQPDILKQVNELRVKVDEELISANDVSFRVLASPIIISNATDKLEPIEADAKLIRYFRHVLGVE